MREAVKERELVSVFESERVSEEESLPVAERVPFLRERVCMRVRE